MISTRRMKRWPGNDDEMNDEEHPVVQSCIEAFYERLDYSMLFPLGDLEDEHPINQEEGPADQVCAEGQTDEEHPADQVGIEADGYDEHPADEVCAEANEEEGPADQVGAEANEEEGPADQVCEEGKKDEEQPIEQVCEDEENGRKGLLGFLTRLYMDPGLGLLDPTADIGQSQGDPDGTQTVPPTTTTTTTATTTTLMEKGLATPEATPQSLGPKTQTSIDDTITTAVSTATNAASSTERRRRSASVERVRAKVQARLRARASIAKQMDPPEKSKDRGEESESPWRYGKKRKVSEKKRPIGRWRSSGAD